jgi:uncharacterized glyoxalase superfamily protein PhnB
MLQSIQQFYGKKLGAVDDPIGHVRDLKKGFRQVAGSPIVSIQS